VQDQDNHFATLRDPSRRRYPRQLGERVTRMVLEAKASGEPVGTH
jgi:hypothetical protein